MNTLILVLKLFRMIMNNVFIDFSLPYFDSIVGISKVNVSFTLLLAMKLEHKNFAR